MADPYGKLRQFNSSWSKGRLFTACIEFMFWYELVENIEDGQGMPEVEKGYWTMVEAIRERIDWFSKSESSKRSKLRRDSLDLFAHALRNTRAQKLDRDSSDVLEPGEPAPVDLNLGGINQITLLQGGADDDSDVYFDAHLSVLSYQRFGLTIEEVMADPQAYVKRCIQAVAGVKFRSGIGGFSFNYEDSYINGNEHLCAPIVGRFKGVNLVNPWRFRDMDGVPTVNWLTLVSNADIGRLGGWGAVNARVRPPVIIHRLPHGALLQAGAQPLLGDVNELERLDAYYAVGALLAPVRSTVEVQSRIVEDRAGTTDWIHRFFTPQT